MVENGVFVQACSKSSHRASGSDDRLEFPGARYRRGSFDLLVTALTSEAGLLL